LEATDQLDRLIERRATGTEAANERERIWKRGLEAHHAEHQEANRHQWATYFKTLARNHARLAEENELRAKALIERKNNE
jgi:hypothetical protein